jgi:pimeloyl-ACP methyl ester carboxylesterase
MNPYDYDRGRGIRRSSAVANLILGAGGIPMVGELVMKLRNPFVEGRILRGGVHHEGSIPPALGREVYAVGSRPGHSRAFLSLVRHWSLWEVARSEYGAIKRPVLLLYGEYDWSRPEEREADGRDIPGSRLRVISNAGHFLTLDAPEEVVRSVTEFVAQSDFEQVDLEGVPL